MFLPERTAPHATRQRASFGQSLALITDRRLSGYLIYGFALSVVAGVTDVSFPLHDADGSVIELVADGTVEGHIAGAPRGNGGFGYDPVFVPDDPVGDASAPGRTFAEMSATEKASISHRGRALRAIAPQLARLP